MFSKIINSTNFKNILTNKNTLHFFYNRYCSTSVPRKMSSTSLETIPKVEIDPSGVFKYIQIKVHDEVENGDEATVIIIRGYKRCNYHSDIFDEVQPKLEPFDCEPIGGGRISHEPNNKKIHIYGYSQGYGKADHEVTAQLIKDAYPGYTISISDEGY